MRWMWWWLGVLCTGCLWCFRQCAPRLGRDHDLLLLLQQLLLQALLLCVVGVNDTHSSSLSHRELHALLLRGDSRSFHSCAFHVPCGGGVRVRWLVHLHCARPLTIVRANSSASRTTLLQDGALC